MNNNTETIEQASDHSIYNINSEKETIIKCCNTLWVEKNPEFVERLVYAFYKRTEAIVKWQKEQDEAKYKELLDSHNELLELIKSDSVYALLRQGVKRPSSTGMDDCDENDYFELYNISTKLRNQQS